MAPDPPVYPVEDECLSHNYDAALAVHNSDESDTEIEDQEAHHGYTLLGQHELGAAIDNEEDSERETDEVNVGVVNNLNQQTQHEPVASPAAELAALWNSAPDEVSSNSIEMDDERSAQIRAAMAGFSLPPSAVPAWASNIPEDLWRERIMGRLQQHIDIAKPTKP